MHPAAALSLNVNLADLLSACNAAIAWYVKLLVSVVLVDLLVSVALVRSPRARYYACYACYVATASTVSIAFLPLLVARFRDPANVHLATQLTRALARLLGVRWEVRGAKSLVKEEAAVVAATHQSVFDVMGVLAIGPALDKVWGVARKEVFYFWPFGLTLWLAGVVFIDRRRGREAYKKLTETMESVKRHKIKLVMFPEGTRNRNGETLLPFKRGAFRTAIEAQIPVIPIVFSPYYFIDSEKRTFHRGKIIISILPSISTEGKTIADLDRFVEKTRAIMEQEFQKLKKEVELTYGSLKY